MSTRLRLGVPVAPSLPVRCVCGHPLTDCYSHLVACEVLSTSAPGQHVWGFPKARNWYDVRHRLLLEQLTKDLVSAEVGVVMEPGVLDPRADGERERDMPDQLITYQAVGRGDGVPKRVTTDLTVVEAVTRATVENGVSVQAKLKRAVAEKVRRHKESAEAAGCSFIPLAFASLGTMHGEAAKFLRLDDMEMDERVLQQLGSGRLLFVARLLEGLSCALARGNARMLFAACAELQRWVRTGAAA